MAKLYFYYSTMNAGKSTILLQSSYNYRERGMNTLILLPEIDTRGGAGKVSSRIGIEAEEAKERRVGAHRVQQTELSVGIAAVDDE